MEAPCFTLLIPWRGGGTEAENPVPHEMGTPRAALAAAPLVGQGRGDRSRQGPVCPGQGLAAASMCGMCVRLAHLSLQPSQPPRGRGCSSHARPTDGSGPPQGATPLRTWQSHRGVCEKGPGRIPFQTDILRGKSLDWRCLIWGGDRRDPAGRAQSGEGVTHRGGGGGGPLGWGAGLGGGIPPTGSCREGGQPHRHTSCSNIILMQPVQLRKEKS